MRARRCHAGAMWQNILDLALLSILGIWHSWKTEEEGEKMSKAGISMTQTSPF